MSIVNAPVHDLLIRIKNAYMARNNIVEWVDYSWFKVKVLEILKDNWFIKNYKVSEMENNKKFISVYLTNTGNKNDIPVIKFISKPSKRTYVSYNELKKVAWWRWIWIISTSKGLIVTDKAKELKVWGELIAEIY